MTEQNLASINILIIRTSAIGDVIMASPLIAALKQKYPNAKLTWLAEPFVSELVKYNPDVSQVITLPKSEFKALWRQKRLFDLASKIKTTANILKRENFDLVIDAQGLLKSSIWAKFSGAKRRVGFNSKEGNGFLLTESIEKPRNDPEISSEYKKMAQYLGCPTERFQMNIVVPDELKSSAAIRLAEKQCQAYVAFCPFTTRPQKHWFNDSWLTLARQIYRVFGLKIVIVGGPEDKEKANELASGDDFIEHFCGQTSLLESVEILSKGVLTVGVDTGMTHASIAKGTPTIALFGSTRPYLDTGGEQTEVVYLDKQCAPCRRRPTCDDAFHCLRDITPARVFESVKSLVHQAETLRLV